VRGHDRRRSLARTVHLVAADALAGLLGSVRIEIRRSLRHSSLRIHRSWGFVSTAIESPVIRDRASDPGV